MNKRILVALCVMLGGCATTPRPVVEGPVSALTPDAARENRGVGPNERVRWGGEILEVTPGENQTCFEVLSQPLDSSGRPRDREDSEDSAGRFIACEEGFYDPAIFTRKRDLTVVGMLLESETRKIGEADYVYPRVQVEKLYLWPKLSEYRYRHYDPYWGWPRFGFGFGHYHPFYYRGRGFYW